MKEGGCGKEGDDERGKVDLRKPVQGVQGAHGWRRIFSRERTGMPFSYRKSPEFGSVEVSELFQPSDHLLMLLSSMSCVGMVRIR